MFTNLHCGTEIQYEKKMLFVCYWMTENLIGKIQSMVGTQLVQLTSDNMMNML